MSIRICGDNTVASPAITSASDTDTGLQFGTNEVKVVNGNLDITDGNLIVASGHGIDFSATADGSGTMQSELLDDYEVGTWTPYLEGHSGTSTISYDSQFGGYQRIGNYVRCWGFIDVDTVTTAGTGNARIRGFPFVPPDNSPYGRGVGVLTITNTSISYVDVHCRGVFVETTGAGAAIMFKETTTSNSFQEKSASATFGTNTQLYFQLYLRAA